MYLSAIKFFYLKLQSFTRFSFVYELLILYLDSASTKDIPHETKT